jgi:tRNA-2-methylthio-N6-dimethylallyladenosine synthase
MSDTASPQKHPPKTFRVKSFGCQMNVYDGERISEMLIAQGMKPLPTTDDAKDGEADLVVLNTCHIREKAAEKVYSDIGRIAKQSGGNARIAIAGCVAQAEGAEIIRRAPAVDLVVGPQAYHRLPDMLSKLAKGERSVDTDMPAISKFDHLPRRMKQGASAFLTVQEGCDKFCTYCVVPYTRGAEISRPWADIVNEAQLLADNGAVEITLLGQNVNAWAAEDDRGRMQGLDGLIRQIAKIENVKRIRYTTSHPNDMTDALIAAHGDVDKLMPYLHLPVQSGSDRILKVMNRSHTTASYLALLDKMRTVRPDIALSGDFIVGFPGESEADFVETLALVDAVGYAQAYSFKYSPRPGTPAADMADQIAAEVMDDRLQRLQDRLHHHSAAFNQASIGRTTEILVERTGRKSGQMIGKSPWLQSVVVDNAKVPIGKILSVEITEAGPNSVHGVVAEKVLEKEIA